MSIINNIAGQMCHCLIQVVHQEDIFKGNWIGKWQGSSILLFVRLAHTLMWVYRAIIHHKMYCKSVLMFICQYSLPIMIPYLKKMANNHVFANIAFYGIHQYFLLPTFHATIYTLVHYPTMDLLRRLGLLKQGVTIFTIT